MDILKGRTTHQDFVAGYLDGLVDSWKQICKFRDEEWLAILPAFIQKTAALPEMMPFLTSPENTSELARVMKENMTMRKIIAESDLPCLYCKLPGAEMGKCKSGFPGCGRADDMMGG